MTDRERESLKAALEAAEAESAAKSRLISHTSHEIRTNLAGVLGLAQAAQETRLTPEQQEFFHLIVSSGDAILTLVNDLLDLSKMEAGMLVVDHTPFNLDGTIDDVVAAYRGIFDARNLSLGVERDERLPTRVVGDPGRIRQVLANLLANAARFTDIGGAVLEVTVQERSADSVRVQFAVKDTGLGVPEDRVAAIFAPYSQANDSVARNRGGSGLGLSISRQLVELMGGTLNVESTVGEGSRFFFDVPLADVSDADVAVSPAGYGDLSDLPMLVLSARPETVQGAMGIADASIDIAADLNEMEKYLDNAVDHPYALLILEGGDALAVAQDLRRREKLETTHIMILTPTGERGDGALCRELRIGGYLTAPYSPDDVVTAAAEVIAGPAPVDLTVLVTRHWLRERRKHLSILVVDDSPTLRMTSSRLLERRGHSVRTVGSGEAAIGAVTAHRYDAIVMDIQMPNMDGFETTERIRNSEFGAEIPIIAVSSHASAEARSRILAAGAFALLARPFDVFDLVSTIERAIGD